MRFAGASASRNMLQNSNEPDKVIRRENDRPESELVTVGIRCDLSESLLTRGLRSRIHVVVG